MAAAWEELAERYKDREDIVIAEMDSTANELENITIHGYPTLHYFPAGPGRKVGVGTLGSPHSTWGTVAPSAPSAPMVQMVEYKSARDVETFSKFLENGGTLPEEPPVSEGRGQPSCPGLSPAPDGRGDGSCRMGTGTGSGRECVSNTAAFSR